MNELQSSRYADMGNQNIFNYIIAHLHKNSISP